MPLTAEQYLGPQEAFGSKFLDEDSLAQLFEELEVPKKVR